MPNLLTRAASRSRVAPHIGVQPRAVLWITALAGILALASASAGLFWRDDGDPFSFTTLHGQTVEIAGEGLYRNDTVFSAAAFRGTDVVTLGVVLPLLVISAWLVWRGSLRGAFLLTGTLSFVLYNGASMALGAAYNPLFLVYVALFSSSLFAFGLAFRAINRSDLLAHLAPGLPRRTLAIFMIVAGVVTALVWLSDIIGALVAGQAPALLGPYTTKVTYALDIAIITPLAVLGGLLIWRHIALGYAIAFPIILLCALVGVMVIAQTIMQLMAGIVFHPVQAIVFIGSWLALSLFAAWLLLSFLRHVRDAPLAVAERWSRHHSGRQAGYS
ncbi:MAG: hypothetical protein SNJ69_05145 [Chloroflexaceae bacterium]